MEWGQRDTGPARIEGGPEGYEFDVQRELRLELGRTGQKYPEWSSLAVLLAGEMSLGSRPSYLSG
jgi:hypothetical protein